jgi:cytochrome c1
MKNVLLVLLAATTIILAVVCAKQGHKLADQTGQLASVERELEQKSQQNDDLRSTQKRIDAQRSELLKQVNRLVAQPMPAGPVASAPTNSPAAGETANPDKDNGGFGTLFSKMLADPEMKKLVREQQGQMVNQLYGPLIKQMGLTPEEAAKFKELLADNQMRGAENAGSLLSGGPTNRNETLEAMAAQQKNKEAQVKELLGDTRFAQYQDYQQTLGERMQLDQFRQQNAGEANALTDQQANQLLAFMKEEKQSAATVTGQSPAGIGQDQAANLQTILSGEQLDKTLQDQEALNQKVYERAKAVLSPEQLDAFGAFQTNQISSMRIGMTMARKFFAPGNGQDQPNR